STPHIGSWRSHTILPYCLSSFLPAAPAKIPAGFEVLRIFRSLDWATVQGYDLHGTWESTTNFQSALFSPRDDPATPTKFSVDLAIQTYLAKRAPARTLLLGSPSSTPASPSLPHL